MLINYEVQKLQELADELDKLVDLLELANIVANNDIPLAINIVDLPGELDEVEDKLNKMKI